MQRPMLMGAAAAALGGCLAAGPAFAQSSSVGPASGNTGANNRTVQTTTVQTTTVQTAGNNPGQAENQQQLIDNATQTVERMEQDDRVRQALKQSKGVFIMPAVTTGAMIVGAQNGEGVLLKHNSDGSWSEPAFLTLHAASIRAQASGKSGSAAMILMSDRALRDFQLANSFSFDGNSGLSIVDYSGQRPAATGTGDIVLWSIQPGGFASATVSGSELHQDLEVDQAFYGRKVDARRILNGEVTSDRAVRLKSALPA